MQCEISTTNNDCNKIKKILQETKTIAIIGLSPNEEKDSNKVARYLQDVGYKIIPVYPKEDIILGEKVYRSLQEIKIEVDLVDIFRKSSFVDIVVDMAIKRGDVKTVWTQLGIVNNSASQRAEQAGIQVIQNLCTKIEHMKLYK